MTCRVKVRTPGDVTGKPWHLQEVQWVKSRDRVLPGAWIGFSSAKKRYTELVPKAVVAAFAAGAICLSFWA
jgi:hypothetical protein